jgi:hypothetical protein
MSVEGVFLCQKQLRLSCEADEECKTLLVSPTHWTATGGDDGADDGGNYAREAGAYYTRPLLSST